MSVMYTFPLLSDSVIQNPLQERNTSDKIDRIVTEQMAVLPIFSQL